MKKPIALTIVTALVLIAAIFGYRRYRTDSDRALMAQRIADEKMAADQKKIEAERQAAAQAEAQRLAQLRAKQDSDEDEKWLAARQSEQAATEAARRANEKEAVRLAAETQRLKTEKENAEAEARRVAADRVRDAAAAEKARQDAMTKLEQIEQEKRDLSNREAARLSALRKQQELEAAAAQQRDLLDRSIYPSDYKRREHYYQQVEMYNAGITKPEGETTPATPPPADSTSANSPR